MDLFVIAFLFLTGSSIGSFVNVLIDRLPRGENLFLSRSHCDSCKKELSFLELIPLLSFLILKGKCRNCKKKIPVRLFFVELLTGLSYCLLFLLFSIAVISLQEGIFLAIILPLFTAIFFIDLINGIVPDELVLAIGIVTASFLILFKTDQIPNHLVSALFVMLFFLLLFLITRGRGMGFGDVKLSFVLGLFLGFPGVLIGTYLAFLTGATVSLILIAWGKKRLKRDTIPFAPFLISSSAASYFLSDWIVPRVLSFLG